VDQDDHRTGGLLDDLLDQTKGVLGAFPEPDESYVGSLPRRDGPHVLDLDFARNHLAPEGGDDRQQPTLFAS